MYNHNGQISGLLGYWFVHDPICISVLVLESLGKEEGFCQTTLRYPNRAVTPRIDDMHTLLLERKMIN